MRRSVLDDYSSEYRGSVNHEQLGRSRWVGARVGFVHERPGNLMCSDGDAPGWWNADFAAAKNRFDLEHGLVALHIRACEIEVEAAKDRGDLAKMEMPAGDAPIE